MTRKRRKFITDSDNSDTEEHPSKSSQSHKRNSSDSLSESSEEEEEWTFDTETRKPQPKKHTKKDEKKSQNSAGSMDSSPDEGELSPSINESISDESDDGTFDDGLDEHCIGDTEDRNKLMSMTEAERERVLFERMEKRESMKTRQEIQRKLKLQKKKEEAAKVDADRKRVEQDNKAAARAQRARKSQSDDKGKGRAIDELRAKRLAHKEKMKSNEGRRSPESKTLLKTKDVYTDDEDDDQSLSPSISSESDDESDHAPAPHLIRYISTKDQLSKIRLSRFKLEKWVHLPFFKILVCGCFIRIGIGDKMGKKIYRVAEIYDVVETPKIYSLGNVKTNKGLKVRHGLAENMYRLEFVSNQDFTESEFQKWKTTVEQNNMKLPNVKEVNLKAVAIKEAMDHEYTNEEIDFIVKEKSKFRKGPRNFAHEKSHILAQRQHAENTGDYAEVEKLKADLEDLETEADRKSKLRNKGLSAISYINDKNRISTSARIEEVLREEFALDKFREPNPFQRRKTVPSVVTPRFQAKQEDDNAELLLKLARERDKQNTESSSQKSGKSDKMNSFSANSVLDPFELHNDCDIDIDIGPIDSVPTISPAAATSTTSKRGLNLSDYKKRTGLM